MHACLHRFPQNWVLINQQPFDNLNSTTGTTLLNTLNITSLYSYLSLVNLENLRYANQWKNSNVKFRKTSNLDFWLLWIVQNALISLATYLASRKHCWAYNNWIHALMYLVILHFVELHIVHTINSLDFLDVVNNYYWVTYIQQEVSVKSKICFFFFLFSFFPFFLFNCVLFMCFLIYFIEKWSYVNMK